MRKINEWLFFLIWLIIMLVPARLYSQDSIPLTSSTIGDLKARHIGPATMSGRISTIDAVSSNPHIVYVGAAGGGIWKSINGGIQFEPVFDKQVQSIGAIAIDQRHPDTVWAGTGESWVRNSVSVGNGVYKSKDGGDNWKSMGLDSTEHIARIAIHPAHPDTVYVAALGHLWDGNKQRGLFRTKDGGKSWERVLYTDENTGCSDIAIDPSDPAILFAAMWDFRRTPYDFRSGGPGSGLFLSKDGGNTWSKLTNGLPTSTLGRIAVAISPCNHLLIYALVEAEKDGGLYRSEDGGNSWKLVNTTPNMKERPFYFSLIVADPTDTMRVYKPGSFLYVSDDGGEKFRNVAVSGGNVHPDLHALWINPGDDRMMYLGTDGGVYKSIDKGNSWQMIRNLPVSQFYHVSVDQQDPYNVYGGLQDNGSWTGPSRAPGGIHNADWKSIGFGDGFYAFADPMDKDILYWQWQGGNFIRYYKSTGELKEIRPYADEKTGKLRWNWNSSIAFGSSSGNMYVGSQYLWKSDNRGDSWKRISPDLTTNDDSKTRQETSGGITVDNSTAENYCTIYTIAESPLDANMIWAGTDDGNLQLTRDGGATWQNVVGNIPGLPNGTWCSSVEVSGMDKGTIFVTFDGHRSGDMKPYLFKSTDYGASFTSLITSGVEGYCFDVVQDPAKPELIFLGTEKGLFTTLDGGMNWARFEGNFPQVAVHDIAVQPKNNDLVLATHGRGIFIIDDITPLRSVSNDILGKELAFLPSRPYLIGTVTQSQEFEGDDEYTGSNPPDGVYITYFMQKRHIFGDMYIEILDNTGKKLTTLTAGKRKGINRVVWTPREKPPKVPVSNNLVPGAFTGPSYLPGQYTVRVVKGDKTFESFVTLKYDPSLPHSGEDRQMQLKTLHRAYSMLEDLAFEDASITAVRAEAEKYATSAGLKSRSAKQLDEYLRALDRLHQSLVATKIGGITGEEQLREKISDVYSAVMRYSGKPTDSQISRLEVLDDELHDKQLEAASLLGPELVRINKLLTATGKEAIGVLTREAFDAEK